MRPVTLLRSAKLYLVRLWREFNRDQCPVRASGLAFASLLALVPVSALLISLFSSLGSFAGIVESIQEFLIRVLVPTKHELILESVNQFVANTRGLGVFGSLVFLGTSVLLLAAIQRTFDAVWGTPSRKNTLSKFATYMSILIVGSFVLSIGLNITGILSSVVADLLPGKIGWFPDAFLKVFPILFLFAAMFFMIRFVPAGPVQSISALGGAVVGTVLWELARTLFVFWANYVIRLSVIYGSLAVVPIFLIWLYLAWTIVLLSLEVAYVHQHRRHIGEGKAVWELEPAQLLWSGLELYLFIAREFAGGSPPPSTSVLSDNLALSERDVAYLLKKYTDTGLLISTSGKHRGYVPSKALATISTEEVVRSVFGSTSVSASANSRAHQLYESMISAAIESLGGKSIGDMIGAPSTHGADPTPPGRWSRRGSAHSGGAIGRFLRRFGNRE
jgi:membrane protein